MTAIPSTSISLPGNPFIGESVDLTLGFDNTGTQTGYGPFVLFYVDKTGADGDDGLTFNSATYLGSAVTTTEYQLSEDPNDSSVLEPITFNVFGVEQTIASSDIPSDFSVGDTLVVMELPFGSFVVDQPQADIEVNLTGSNLADLNTPINLQSQGGFVFGNTATEETDGSDDPIYENISGDPVDTVTPQLVTLTKNYIGPEDETATGPNFVRQFELVVDIAEGQTISNLDITDILPDNMQFVDVVSIEDSNGTEINSSRITDVATPDDGGLTSIGSKNTTENDVNSDHTPTPGGTLTRRIDNVTGTSGSSDLVLTYEFFIPRLDANSNVIIDAVTGDDIISTNESQLGDNDDTDSNNTWNPLDPRDPVDPVQDPDLLEEIYIPPTATDSNDPTHDLEDQSIAIQKSVTNLTDSANSPGDVLEYTIDFQVSDYFALQNIDIFDTFSDGQRFDTSFIPTLYITEHEQSSGSVVSPIDFDAANYIVDESEIGNDTNPDTDGTTEVTFEISDELITRNFDDNDGKLIGGGVIDGSSSGKTLYNNPVLLEGATEGQIVFRTVIQQEYSDTFVSGDASVDIGDRLDNSAIINGEVLDIDTLEPVLDPTTTDPDDYYQEDDDTSAAVTIEEGELYKSIYAINGEIYDADGNSSNGFSAADDDLSDGSLDGYVNGVNISPGDEVTYRLTYELPTTDVEDLTLTDYFPLPIYNAETEFDLNSFDSSEGDATVPNAGSTKYGPLDSFSTRTDAGGNNPVLTFGVSNNGSNKLTYSYADFDDDDNQSSIVDILVTVTAYDEPAADGLLYTNQVRQTNQTTFNEDSFLDKIIQVTLDQPEVLEITKGVVAYSSDNTDITFDSPFTAPNGVTFATGSGINFATGADPISSSHLDPDPNISTDDNPIDSNLTGGLEAGDLVTFAITVENTGNSRTGVFDITLQDDLPTGFKIPDAGLNLNITDGTGATINYIGLDDNDGSGDDLFATGIELVDPGSDPDTDAGALSAYSETSGENLAIVTFDLEVDDSAPYQNSDDTRNTAEEITNTATLVSYASTDNGDDFSAGLTDSATVEMNLPEATKSIVATSEPHTDEIGDGTTNNNSSDTNTTGRRKLAIGEIIRYRLVATIPEGTANNFQLRDRLPGGLLFLDDDTTTVAFISDDAPITSVDTTTDYTNPLTIGLGSPATFDNNLWISGTSDSGITPTFTLDKTNYDSNIGNNNDIGNDNNGSDVDPDDYFSGKDPYFKFGDITNSDRDADDEYVIVEFNALVTNDYQNNAAGTNITTNDAGENRNNKFDVYVGSGTNFDFGTNNNGNNNDDSLVQSNTIYSRIVEPQLSLVKEVGSSSTFSNTAFAADAGDTVQFKLTFSNAGNTNQNATAFDVSLTDTVPAGLTLTGIDSVSWDNGDAIDGSAETGTENSVTSGTNIVTTDADMTITPTFDTGTGAISVDVDQMPTDAEISVIYSATVDRDVNPDELITNTADITYSSLPGDDPDGTSGTSPGTSESNTTDNPTGSDVNDTTSGDPLSERNGDSATNSANDYSASASGNVQIDPLVPVKSLISTSETATSTESEVTIGEIVRYRLAVEIPEGETAGFTITDDLPAGLTYIGNPKLAFVADGTGTTSGVYSDDPDILNNPQVTDSSFTNPTYDLTTGITDASGDSTFTSGEDVTFSLGNITNADDDTDEEYVVVEFNALVENIDANDNGGTLANSFQVSASSPTQTQTSDPVNVTIAEPILGSITHTASPETGDAGDTITYTVEFSNDGSATAYDLNITDTLPAELDNLVVSSVKIFDDSTTPVDVTSSYTVNTTSTSSSDGTSTDTSPNIDAFDIDINELPANYSVEIEYTATIVGDVTTEADIQNTVDVTYSSLPGDDPDGTSTTSPGTSDTNPTGSDVNDTTSGNADSERNSSSNGEGSTVNNYQISSTETVTVDPLVPVKRLVATSESHTADDDVAIGEIVRYQLEVKIPEGETPGFSITDNLPDGLKYLGNPKIAFIADDSTDGIDSTTITDADPNTAPNLDLTGTTATTPEFDLTTGIADASGDSTFTSGEDVTFSLGDLTNSDRDSEDDEYVVIEFNALVENISTNVDTGTPDTSPLSNEFTVSATGATDRTSNPVTVDIVEPSIIDVSQTVSSTTADAGDTLTYTVTFSNTGTADAFDLNLADILPTELDNLANISVKIFDNSPTPVDVTSSFTVDTTDSTSSNDGTSADSPNADALDIDIDRLPVEYSVEIQYTADVVGDIAPESEINSTVELTYTSLDGTGTANNDTGSDNTAATSGASDGERNGSGTSPNTYTDSNDTATNVTINSLNAVKTLASTSETSTTNSDVIIGETVRYQLAVELPEGQTDNFKITDAIPNGITYSGNAKLAFVANGSGISSNDSNLGTSPQITGAAAATPTFDLPSSAIADAGANSSFDSGEDVIFDLSDLTNADRDSDSEYVVIEFDGIVDGVGSNASLDNTFTVTAASDNSITATSGTTTVDVTLDYGDAPDSGSTTPNQGDYLTLATTDGASHGIRTGLTLGENIDADDGTAQNSDADADGADEDGIESFSILETGASSYTVSVNVTNDTGGNATLVGWIDFNRNGNFESGEAVIADVPDNTTTANPISLIWDRDTLTGGTVGDGYGELPNINEIVSGDTYARFRLSTDADLDDALSTGIVDDGEVEDYQLTIYNTVDGNPYSDTITEADNVPDLITAGEGQDTLTGGTGKDIFVYTKTSDGVDIIEDFEDGTDKIDLSALVASGGELDGIIFTDDPFTDGYVEAVSFGSHTMIQVDFDNSGTLPKDVVLLNNINSTNATIDVNDFIF